MGDGAAGGAWQAGSRRPPWHRRALALVTLLTSTWGLAACGLDLSQRPVVLYVALSTLEDEAINREISRKFRERVNDLVAGFRRVHPNVVVQIAVYPEREFQRELERRTASGLGPDLIVTSADHGNVLLARGLTVPMPLAAQEREAIDPLLLERIRDRRGRLASLPLMILTQLACFDRRRVAEPITRIEELGQRSLAGLRVGLALDPRDLIWSAGSFGAVPALLAIAEGRQPDASGRQALLAWLRWLQEAVSNQQINLQADDLGLRHGLHRGQLDWISCSSSDLLPLQRALGPHLGVSVLPGGEEHRALQVRPLRVMALGRNSSPRQRELAIALSLYSFKPLVQRNFLVNNMVGMPVNRYVNLPRNNDGYLATMQQALQQDDPASSSALLANLHSGDPRLKRLQEVFVPLVFGVIEPNQALQNIWSILHPSNE